MSKMGLLYKSKEKHVWLPQTLLSAVSWPIPIEGNGMASPLCQLKI